MAIVDELTASCVKYAGLKGVSFTYKGKSLSHEEVFASFGILPGIVKRANKMSSVCLGSSMGLSFPKREKSYLGYALEVGGDHMSLPIMMLFIVDVLEVLVGNQSAGVSVPLDEFGYE